MCNVGGNPTRVDTDAAVTGLGRERAELQREIDGLSARLESIAGHILNAHGRALPPNWVYTDSETTVDLLVAEIICLRKELAELDAQRQAARADALEDAAIIAETTTGTCWGDVCKIAKAIRAALRTPEPGGGR